MATQVEITTDSTDEWQNQLSQRNIDFCQNGVLWTSFLSPDAEDIRFWYSDDDGATWNFGTALTNPGVGSGELWNTGWSFFIDKDDYIHVIAIDQSASNNTARAHYFHGAPTDASCTAWAWDNGGDTQPPIGSAGFLDNYLLQIGWSDWPDIVAFEDPADSTKTKVFWSYNYVETGPNFTGFVQQLSVVKSTGIATVQTKFDLQTINTFQTMISLDFKHTAADPKTPTDGNPHIYVAYVCIDAAHVLLYRKISHSAGTWTAGTARTIDAQATRADINLVFDGTDPYVIYLEQPGDGVIHVVKRDEADTTTTQVDPTALAEGTPNEILRIGQIGGNLRLMVAGSTTYDVKKIARLSGSWGSWSLMHALTAATVGSIMRGPTPDGLLGSVYYDGNANTYYYSTVAQSHSLSASFQGVATLEGALTRVRELTGTLQGIARWAKAKLTKTPQGAPDNFVEPDIDFTVFDGYLEGGDGVVHSLIYHEDGETKGTTAALPTRAEKQDVGTNPLEQRPEFGDFFAQGDFSNGANQLYFHHVGRDPKKFLASEGYDITEEGSLTHLHQIAEAVNSATIGAVTQANGVILVAVGSDVQVSNGAFPGTWTPENPEAGGSATTVADLTSRGDEVFAALGAEGIHIRSSAGSWSHYQPDTSTDLDVGTATRVAWLKDRLFVVGTAGREIFEVVGDSTPTAIKTLPEGWTFESIFEAGAFVYAPAVNADAGLSRIHIFGLNNDATVIEDKGSVQVPRGELFYSGIGYVGQVFLGGGKSNDDGGYDPILYQAVQDDTGFLNLARIARGVGGSTDCSVLSFEALGDSIVFGWSQASAALTGERAGIAMYHLGRQAFSQHLKKDAVSSAQIQDILFFEGRLVLSIDGDGLYYEDTATFVDDAFLISSIADWGGASLKVWDRAEVSHGTLVADNTVTVQYTTEDPAEEEWFSTIISATDGATGASSKLSNVISRIFAIKLSSTANAAGTAAPLIQSFSIRSNLTRAQPEFTMTRFVRILAKDRKDGRGSVVYKDPIEERLALMLLLDSWVTVWEPGIIWNAFIQGVSDTEPAEPFLSGTNGEPLKEAYLVRLDMVATGEAA